MKNQLTLLAILILCLTACKKDSNPKEPEETPVKLLSRIIEVHTDFLTGTKTIFTTFTYDEKKRISTIKKSGIDETIYTYHGDELFSIELRPVDGSGKNVYELFYQGGKPTKITRKIGIGNLARETTDGYIYTGDRVTQINTNEKGIVVAKTKFTYLGDNIQIKETDAGQVISLSTTYGNKKNMYYNSRLKYVNNAETFDRFSVNEVLKKVVSYPDGATLEHINTYTYDLDDFPITLSSSITHSSSGSTSSVYKYTFEYKMY